MIKPLSQEVYSCMMLGTWPGMAACVDFGINSDYHYAALQSAIRRGIITLEGLDNAIGDGWQLTRLVNSNGKNPYPGIIFETAWDNLQDEDDYPEDDPL